MASFISGGDWGGICLVASFISGGVGGGGSV